MKEKSILKKSIKVAIYARVSTDEQAKEGHSIDNQIETLTRVIKDNHVDYTITKYIDDGWSASRLDRPSYLSLIEDLEYGLIDALYIWDLDRLNRNLFAAYGLITRVLELKIKMYERTNQIKLETPDEEMTLLFKLMLIHMELIKTKYRTSETIKGAIRSGLYVYGGKPPYGYIRVGKNEIIFNPEKKAIIEQAIQEYVRTPLSVLHIAVTHDIPHETLNKILTKTIYRGYITVDNESFKVTSDIYIDEYMVERIEKKQEFWAKRSKYVYLFKKKLICHICGVTLSAVSTNKKGIIYLYYTCKNSNCNCFNSRINETIVENSLNSLITNIFSGLTRQEKEKYQYDYNNNFDSKIIFDQIKKLHLKNESYVKSMNKAKKLFLDHEITHSELQEHTRVYNNKIKKNNRIINDASATFNYDKQLKSEVIRDKLDIIAINLISKKIIKQ